MIESLESELAVLREQLDQYEALRREREASQGEVAARAPVLLIEGRIAAGLTQRQLAERLGLQEQQIQRYESTCTRAWVSIASKTWRTQSGSRSRKP